MKYLFNIILATFLFNNLLFSQNKIVGKWLTEDKEATVQITEKNGKYYGCIIWLKNPNDEKGKPILDSENPDKVKSKIPVLGLQILKNFEFKRNEWVGGTIYDPTDGKTYSCKIWLEGNTLKVRGYWGFVYQTETWTMSN